MTVAMNNEPTWCPAIEFTETDTALILKAEVPGVERKHLNIRVNPESVSITGVHPEAKHRVEKEIIPSELHYGRVPYSRLPFSLLSLSLLSINGISLGA